MRRLGESQLQLKNRGVCSCDSHCWAHGTTVQLGSLTASAFGVSSHAMTSGRKDYQNRSDMPSSWRFVAAGHSKISNGAKLNAVTGNFEIRANRLTARATITSTPWCHDNTSELTGSAKSQTRVVCQLWLLHSTPCRSLNASKAQAMPTMLATFENAVQLLPQVELESASCGQCLWAATCYLQVQFCCALIISMVRMSSLNKLMKIFIPK